MKRQKLGRSLLLGLALVLAALYLLIGGGVERLDHMFYDAMLKVHLRPASDELVIVAIDDKSLRELGRWPWSRRLHAEMLDKLAVSGARAVGIDILLAGENSNDPDGDVLLANAIENSDNVVLVVGPEVAGATGLISEVLPLPAFALNAARLAHIDFEMDKDGICRSVYLQAGLGNPHWPVMGLALLDIAYPDMSFSATPDTAERMVNSVAWVREQPILIAYSGPPGHFKRVSYVDVLRDRVPADVLRDRIVMIGATAVGMGDSLSTPLSTGHTLMPGVEVNANVLSTLLDGLPLQEASQLQHSLVSFLFILMLLAWLFVMPERLALPGYLLAAALTLLFSLGILYIWHVWFPPAIPLLLQTVLYIAWSWLDLGQFSRLSQRLTRQMHIQARSDRVTGLPNRPQLEERLQQLLAGEQDKRSEFALLVLSMGRHRSVIDLAGMRGNDQLHQQIAARLARTLPAENMVYRMDGAEFAVLIDRDEYLPRLEQLAARLVQSLLRPFQLGDDQFIISPSIGASRCPQDGEQAQALIDNAYTAMHQARQDVSRSFFFYSKKIKAGIDRQSSITQALGGSVWREGIRCVYQPQIRIDSGRLAGVETLVRWRHPVLGEISPDEFIPVAEREGLIVPIGNWVLQQACVQGQLLRQSVGQDLRIAVNVSALQLNTPGLVEVVGEALLDSGLPAANLELELTETAVLSDHDQTLAILTSLKELGVELAIDDFGTGYSSLTYLKNFPIDRIKIDQSFVSDVHKSNESAEITRSIVAMTRGLDLEVIAEGVERPEHLAFLRELGAEEAQGYLVGKPMSPSELEAAVAAGELLPC